MKVLVVANGIARGGVSRVLSVLTQEWAKSHDVYVSLFRSKNDLPFEVSGKILMHDISLRGCVISQVIHLYFILRTNSFDRIIGFSDDANYPLILAAKLAGVADRTVLSVHNANLNHKVSKRINKTYGYARRILAVSDGVKDILLRVGLEENKLRVIPNPINISLIKKNMCKVNDIKMNPLDFNIVSVGRLHFYKGFDTLIASFVRVSNKIPEAKLWIIGEGPERSNLEELIKSHNLTSKVILCGYYDNPHPFVYNADLFVLPSRFEGFGLVLIEAMCAGTPVVAFDCPYGPSEIIENECNGVLIPDQDEEKLSMAIVRLYTDKETCIKMIKNGFVSASKYDSSNVANYWLD